MLLQHQLDTYCLGKATPKAGGLYQIEIQSKGGEDSTRM